MSLVNVLYVSKSVWRALIGFIPGQGPELSCGHLKRSVISFPRYIELLAGLQEHRIEKLEHAVVNCREEMMQCVICKQYHGEKSVSCQPLVILGRVNLSQTPITVFPVNAVIWIHAQRREKMIAWVSFYSLFTYTLSQVWFSTSFLRKFKADKYLETLIGFGRETSFSRGLFINYETLHFGFFVHLSLPCDVFVIRCLSFDVWK